MKITLPSVILFELRYHQDSLFDPYCYKTLGNHFHKSITLRKEITSVNSTTKMYPFQQNILMSFDGEQPLMYMIYLNFLKLSLEKL